VESARRRGFESVGRVSQDDSKSAVKDWSLRKTRRYMKILIHPKKLFSQNSRIKTQGLPPQIRKTLQLWDWSKLRVSERKGLLKTLAK